MFSPSTGAWSMVNIYTTQLLFYPKTSLLFYTTKNLSRVEVCCPNSSIISKSKTKQSVEDLQAPSVVRELCHQREAWRTWLVPTSAWQPRRRPGS